MVESHKQGYSIFNETIADMTWMEVEKAANNNSVMLVPIGAIEQHGPHLPTGTDTYLAYHLCLLTKKELEKQEIPAVIAPPYYFGITQATRGFPGSINIRQETMVTLLSEILVSYMNSGFKKQFILNFHGEPEHVHAILDAVTKANEKGVEAVYLIAGSSISDEWNIPITSYQSLESESSWQEIRQYLEAEVDIHAGELETSAIMKWFPETLKDEDNIAGYEPKVPSSEELQNQSLVGGWKKRFPLGYVGEPHRAEPSKAEVLNIVARDAAKAIAQYIN